MLQEWELNAEYCSTPYFDDIILDFNRELVYDVLPNFLCAPDTEFFLFSWLLSLNRFLRMIYNMNLHLVPRGRIHT